MTKKMAKIFMIAVAVMCNDVFSQDNVQMANIVSVTPVTDQVKNVKRQCGGVAGTQQNERSYTGALLGGGAGALIGRQIGKGTANVVATIAGGVVGAVIGDNIDNRSQPNCNDIVTYEPRAGGYLIVYELNGQQYAVRSQTFPQGRQIPVQMAPAPIMQ